MKFIVWQVRCLRNVVAIAQCARNIIYNAALPTVQCRINYCSTPRKVSNKLLWLTYALGVSLVPAPSLI